ncbi:MAG TPA: hypothetical protein VF519_16830 [Mycobacteriales bacterium]|jgi:hypothetical protein
MNDLSRLLDSAVPEPPRPLAAAVLVARARRRRAARTAAFAGVVATAVVAGVAVAGGTVRDPGRPAAPVATVSPGVAGAWPVLPAAGTCARTYPDVIEGFDIAVDATVVGVRHGERTEVDLAVHHVYRGPQGGTLTLTARPGEVPDTAVGLRGLFAVYADRALTTCGYSRPYSVSDAAAWHHVFEAPDTCGLWRDRAFGVGYDEPSYVGLTVADATARARREGWSVRLVGDAALGLTKDFDPGRLNLCDRDGVVTSALRA